ncbi:hypothetical protein BTJ39_22050 [Izhakiella australiensis]|uniref:FkbM family methyltransferase n=1 Tax=Izhakiella australiensis TaxID=1926881 RepID=A0A1S8Y951_9GAMM|nr:FkbM family methyltransferase [Izhakiella australiensis]OON35649.1 hypothetical protein BTJ39_22050 [Izhakiella australiensis]
MSEQTSKISVILPVYGGEKYLKQCLDSVLTQTYTNLEIIIVNDGSPDGCPAIIDQYASKDKRIVAIHKENQGYGAAINSGLEIATGEFVAVIETDDWVQLDMFERLIIAYDKKPNPIIKATFSRISNEVCINTQSLSHIAEFDDDNLAEVIPETSVELFLLESSIWSALYKRSFLTDNFIKFYESPGASYQDMPFKFICYAIADKVTLLNISVYNYRVMNSGSSSASADRALISFNNYDIIKNYLVASGKFPFYIDHFYFHHMFDLVFHSARLKGQGLKEYRDKAIAIFEQAKSEGFEPQKSDIVFSPDTNDYYHNHVLPVYNELMRNGVINPVSSKNKVRRFIINKIRYLANKILIEPLLSSLSSKFDSSFSSMSNRVSEKIDILDSNTVKYDELKQIIDDVNALKSTLIGNDNSNGQHNRGLLKETVLVHVAPTDQFYYYMKTYAERISELRSDFRKGLDEFSLLNERKLFGFYEILPYFKHTGINLSLPLSLTLFTDEDRVVLSNFQSIIDVEKNNYSHLDTTELPVTLATNYYKSGLKYLPNGLTEKFKGSVAIDCGAWVGDTSIMFASFGFQSVIALEPIADNYNCMLRNIERNKQYLGDIIKPLNVAVGDTEGHLSMVKVGDDGVGSCVVDDDAADMKVKSITIDSLSGDERIGMIKFDVEGYELMALRGGEETIRKHKPVLLISVYHLWLQPEQIFDCKKFVEGLNLDYKFKLVHVQPERDLIYEYMLVCW